MRSFFAELRRRNVLRAGVLYVGAVWALAQGISQLGPSVGAPDWATRWFLVAAAIGFPLFLGFAWFFEFTPEGLKLESQIDPADSITAHTGKRLDRWIIGALALAVVLLLTNTFVWHKGAGLSAAAQTDAPLPDIDKDPSIAVLPLVNMSEEKGNEYFSDGISEELINLLAKVPKLRVIARTSSFSFKGKEVGIPDIARALNVAALLEGSVRKSGNTVRITVQLIRASDSSYLWSETYDRTLDDIFRVQDEIAAKVVDKLKITLLGALPTTKTIDPKAYALILQANFLSKQGTPEDRVHAISLNQQALAIAPEAARAWVTLAGDFIIQSGNGERPPLEGRKLAREAVNKALAIDPDEALAHSLLGWIAMSFDDDFATAAQHFQRALQLSPTNVNVLGNVAIFVQNLGRLDEAIALLQYQIAHDPANPRAHLNIAYTYYAAQRWDQAIASSRTVLTLSPGRTGMHAQIGMALLGKGEAASALAEMQAEPSETARMAALPLGYFAVGHKDESDAALAALIAKQDKDSAYAIALALAYRGEADGAFEWLDKAVAYQPGSLPYLTIEPMFAKLRQDPRWLPLLRKLGVAPDQLAKIEFKVTLPTEKAAQ